MNSNPGCQSACNHPHSGVARCSLARAAELLIFHGSTAAQGPAPPEGPVCPVPENPLEQLFPVFLGSHSTLRSLFGSISAAGSIWIVDGDLVVLVGKTHPGFSVAFDVQLLCEGLIYTLLFLPAVRALGSCCSSPAEHSLGSQSPCPRGDAGIRVQGNWEAGKTLQSLHTCTRSRAGGRGDCSRNQVPPHGPDPKKGTIIPDDATREAPTATRGELPPGVVRHCSATL